MDKKQIVGYRILTAFLVLLLFVCPLPVLAAGQEDKKAADMEASEDTIYSLDEEDLEAFLDFVKEKLGVKELDDEDGLRDALKAGEDAGSEIVKGFEKLYEEYQQKLEESAQKVIKEQVAEPVAEAAKTAVENTAKTFWQDLTDSVVSFFKNIFAAIRKE